jgi:hypothetical protein
MSSLVLGFVNEEYTLNRGSFPDETTKKPLAEAKGLDNLMI